MKLLTVVALFFAVAFLSACEQSAGDSEAVAESSAEAPAAAAPLQSAADISASELNDRITAGKAPLIIDVRTPKEFAAGHLPGAVNISHTDLGASAAANRLPGRLDTEIVVHCQTGRRATMAQATLTELGFKNVRHLDGDYAGWAEAGLPVVAAK